MCLKISGSLSFWKIFYWIVYTFVEISLITVQPFVPKLLFQVYGPSHDIRHASHVYVSSLCSSTKFRAIISMIGFISCTRTSFDYWLWKTWLLPVLLFSPLAPDLVFFSLLVPLFTLAMHYEHTVKDQRLILLQSILLLHTTKASIESYSKE